MKPISEYTEAELNEELAKRMLHARIGRIMKNFENTKFVRLELRIDTSFDLCILDSVTCTKEEFIEIMKELLK